VLRFLVDMNLSPMLANELRKAGHDCVHALERGAGKWSDAQIAVLARTEKRCIVTADLDFTDLAAVTQDAGPSVVILRLRDTRPASCLGRLLAALEVSSEAISAGAIIVVDENKARVRRLPLRP
jgi:predicted nuclease of predicted toxin-antitoxin system